MGRHRVLWLTIFAFVLMSLACNAFAGTAEPVVPPPPTLAATDGTLPPVVAAPTVTLPGSATETPGAGTPTATAAGPQVQALVDLNVRTGPGVGYGTDSFLLEGETAVIIGKDPAASWWKINCPARSTGPECWVSGRAQYTAVTNVENVPVAVVPPTPTTEPDDLGAIVVYIENGRLTLLTLDTAKTPPAAGAPRILSERSDVQSAIIAPNGRLIAYKVGGVESSELRVINVDGSDDRLVVQAASLPLPAGRTVDAYVLQVAQVQWTADSQRLIFNTDLQPRVGITLGNQADLWSVTLDGTTTQIFAPGQGGAAFAVSASNQVLMTQATAVLRANLDGSNRETMIQFDMINTASEYIYYPQPQWSIDGSRAFVAIPSREPFMPEATAALWQIPAVGTAVQLGTLPGNILFNPVTWSANGAQLAYVRQVVGSANVEPQLMIGSSSGQDVGVYNSAEQITFFEWSPDNTHFLYTIGSLYAIGRASAGPMTISIPAGQQARAGQWLTADTFVVAVGSGGAWTLSSGDVNGTTTPLLTLNSSSMLFDVWAP
ncbi:MAG: hypothetical protein KC443_08630 [Anaerolineales bacterium]|nr:hypothetical protein [Anaerolineales bacterium]